MNHRNFARNQIEKMKRAVGEKRVISALSGGVDSSVATVMAHRALGRKLETVFIDDGSLLAGNRCGRRRASPIFPEVIAYWLINEVDRIATNTAFNDNNLLNVTGTTFEIALGLGLGAGKTITLTSKRMDAEGVGIGGAKEYIVAEEWVPLATTAFITNANAGVQTWTIQITNQDNIDVAFGISETKTLEEVVTAINYGSRATAENYDAAEVVYNAETDMYTLKVSAKDAGNEAITFTANANIDWAAGLHRATENVDIADFLTENGSGTAIDIKANPAGAITAIEAAIEEKDKFRAELGYTMTRLEAAAAVIDIQAENLVAAESRISDVDVAVEVASMTRNQVLAQAGIAMLGQANMIPQMALQLL